MKRGFPDWLTCQVYLAISVSLMTAYGVSVLHHSQSATKQKLSEKNLVSLSKKQKVVKCLPFHFWAVASVKMKFN
jgi:hypothetical protein